MTPPVAAASGRSVESAGFPHSSHSTARVGRQRAFKRRDASPFPAHRAARAPALPLRDLRRIQARRWPVRPRGPPGRRQGSRLCAPDRRSPGGLPRARHVGARHHRRRVRHSPHRGGHRQHALSRHVRPHRAGISKARRREPRRRLSQAPARRSRRREGLHPHHRDAVVPADRGDPDVRGSARRGRRRPTSRSSSTAAMRSRPRPTPSAATTRSGTAGRPRQEKPREDPRIPGQGAVPQVRHPRSARHSRLQRRPGGAGGEAARRSGLGRQGADPRRRARQGRRRQGRQVASTRCASARARSSACSSSRIRPARRARRCAGS